MACNVRSKSGSGKARFSEEAPSPLLHSVVSLLAWQSEAKNKSIPQTLLPNLSFFTKCFNEGSRKMKTYFLNILSMAYCNNLKTWRMTVTCGLVLLSGLVHWFTPIKSLSFCSPSQREQNLGSPKATGQMGVKKLLRVVDSLEWKIP